MGTKMITDINEIFSGYRVFISVYSSEKIFLKCFCFDGERLKILSAVKNEKI
jgi:hypothetical protein